jgi:hypothetical protein
LEAGRELKEEAIVQLHVALSLLPMNLVIIGQMTKQTLYKHWPHINIGGM